MGGESRPTQTSSSRSYSGPWGPQQQFLNQGFQAASDLYNRGPAQYYPGQTYVDPSQYSLQGIQGLANMPNVRNDPLYGAASGYIGNQLSQTPDISGIQGYLGNMMNRQAPMPERYGTQYGYGYQAGGPAYETGPRASAQPPGGSLGNPANWGRAPGLPGMPNAGGLVSGGAGFSAPVGDYLGLTADRFQGRGNQGVSGAVGRMNQGGGLGSVIQAGSGMGGKGGGPSARPGPTQGGMANPANWGRVSTRVPRAGLPNGASMAVVGASGGGQSAPVTSAPMRQDYGYGNLSPMAQMWEMARQRGGR